MDPTSFSISKLDENKFRELQKKSNLQPYEFALQLAKLAAKKFLGNTITKGLVQYQERVDGNKYHYRASDWNAHAAAALRNCTGMSFSRLVVMGLYLLIQDESQWNEVRKVPKLKEFVVSTISIYTKRKYNMGIRTNITFLVPAYPMFVRNIPRKYRFRHGVW
jgi:hypothetical protein